MGEEGEQDLSQVRYLLLRLFSLLHINGYAPSHLRRRGYWKVDPSQFPILVLKKRLPIRFKEDFFSRGDFLCDFSLYIVVTCTS